MMDDDVLYEFYLYILIILLIHHQDSLLAAVAKGTQDALVSIGYHGGSFSAAISCSDEARRAYRTSNFKCSSPYARSTVTASVANVEITALANNSSFRNLVQSNVATRLKTFGKICYSSAASTDSVPCDAGLLESMVGIAGSSAVTAFMSMTMTAVFGYFMLL